MEHWTFDSSRWVVVMAGTGGFKRSIPESAYRSQVRQHAAATGIEYVLMVYAAPGALIKQMVRVYVTEDQQMKLVDFQSQVTSKYLSFACQESGVQDIPSLVDDFSPAYGYAQEHETLVLWVNLWYCHQKDVKENGTPPSCPRLVDLTTSAWNKSMGNVGTIRDVISCAMAVCDHNSGPASLLWDCLFDYTLYPGF